MAKSGNTTQDIRLSVRLTPEERLELEARAGGERLSRYVRQELLGRSAKSRSPDIKKTELAQILALLGASDIGSSLKTLADASKSGNITDEEATSEIQAARAELAEVKSLLMNALRVKEG